MRITMRTYLKRVRVKLRELKTQVYRIMEMSLSELNRFKEALGVSDVDDTARGFMIRAIELRENILNYDGGLDGAMIEYGEAPRED